jgi:hypothetical protein
MRWMPERVGQTHSGCKALERESASGCVDGTEAGAHQEHEGVRAGGTTAKGTGAEASSRMRSKNKHKNIPILKLTRQPDITEAKQTGKKVELSMHKELVSEES